MPHASLPDGTQVHYLALHEPAGPPSDPPLVLLHGTGGAAQLSFGHLAAGLGGERRRVIGIDYAGSGDTTDPGGRLELAALVAQVRAAIEHAGLAAFDLLGFSLGACVAAAIAADDPGGLRRLVLLSGWARSADDARLLVELELWEELASADPEALARLLLLTGYSPAFMAARPRRALDQALAQTVRTLAPGFARQAELDRRIDLTAALPRIAAPTLVLGAAHDHMVPPHHARRLAELIPAAQYAELSTGHLSIYEDPAALTDAARAFLEAPDAPRAATASA